MEDDPPPQETFTLTREEYNQVVEAVNASRRLEQTIAGLQQQLETARLLTATPNRTPSPVRMEPKAEAPKVNPPALFSGERDELETYLTRCEHIFLTTPQKFPKEQAKVLYASTYLSGTAYSWFIPLLQQYSIAVASGPDSIPIPNEFLSWKNYRDSLIAMFGDPDIGRTKTREIKALKQTSSVSVYTAEFRRLQPYIPWNDRGFFDAFYDGLRENVKDSLVHERPKPQTLNQLMAAALGIDNRIHKRILERKSLHPPTGLQRQTPVNTKPPVNTQVSRNPFLNIPRQPASQQTAPAPPPPPMLPPPSDGSTPMEVDRQGYPLLTPEQKAARKKHRTQNNLCLYCGSNAHRVLECPLVPSRRTVNSMTPAPSVFFNYDGEPPDHSITGSTNYQTQLSTNGDAQE
jgi:hypothetical protein